MKKMRENFEKCLIMLLKHEGGFVEHPDDPGGATNKGITHKTYSNFLGRPLEDVNELKNIPDDIESNIVDEISKSSCGDRSKLLNYFMQSRLKNLTETIGEF